MSEEVTVVATVQARAGMEAEVEGIIRTCVSATRHESGCRLYTAHTDPQHAGRFVFIERWESREALAKHEQEPHFLAMAEAFKTRIEGPIEVQLLRELV
ncbi:putative quinol monooxygenase [Caballeronia sp. M1242]|uniref:putative quinol monooxygenase n=1 Tax=Caballeronia sp. M1242 TaxID=2814653 RepID=UPI0019D042F0|nr:putative quinol monooxygenase [Caballeronia sp. M1242]QSN64192.1 antibiotic biosynthesis monooxygenase [Caballeronia sp. M1242]